jgi:large subunit ribosomal protein L9
MKVILNKDLATLGEEGDVKDVAKGYARNYLFPRGIALPYTEQTIKLFESRKEEIEARKAEKRKDAAGVKEKLESLDITITMPAGANGKLYGAVTTQTIADELARQGYKIERKRIELAGNSLKSVGKYKATVKLYESAAAEIVITVAGQAIKTESAEPHARGGRRGRRDDSHAEKTGQGTPEAPEAAGQAVENAAPETSETVAAENTTPETAAAENPAAEASATVEVSAAMEAAAGETQS